MLGKYETIQILEIGFGTGLNCILSLEAGLAYGQNIRYTALEPHPISVEEAASLNYSNSHFQALHSGPWQEDLTLNEHFVLQKLKLPLQEFETNQTFHLVYLDAFDAAVQPELWTTAIFEKLSGFLEPGSTLVTYSSKGEVRRSMIKAGLKPEKIPGPPFKREMLRAIK